MMLGLGGFRDIGGILGEASEEEIEELLLEAEFQALSENSD